MPFLELSRPGDISVLIPGLSRVCTNPDLNSQKMYNEKY